MADVGASVFVVETARNLAGQTSAASRPVTVAGLPFQDEPAPAEPVADDIEARRWKGPPAAWRRPIVPVRPVAEVPDDLAP